MSRWRRTRPSCVGGGPYHTAQVVSLSSARFDYILGSIEYILSYQLDENSYIRFVPLFANLGSRPQYKKANIGMYGLLVDYEDLFLTNIGEYFLHTGDSNLLSLYCVQIKKLAAARLAFIDPVSSLEAGILEVSTPFSFLGLANGSAIAELFAHMFDKITPIAHALGDEEALNLYSNTAYMLRESLIRQFWSDRLRTYSLSTVSPAEFSLTGIAWVILPGAANQTQTASSIVKLEGVRFGVGYKTTSSDKETDDYQLTPNPSGFLIEALFKSQRDSGVNSTTAITHLIDNLWGGGAW